MARDSLAADEYPRDAVTTVTERSHALATIDATTCIPALERVLGMSRAELALALKVHPRTVERWIAGDVPQRNNGRERLEGLVRLTDGMVALFGHDRVREWLETESPCLALLTPKEVLVAGRLDRVNAAIQALISGTSV